MAARQSMTTPEIVAKTMIEEHADFLHEAVTMVARELMKAEEQRCDRRHSRRGQRKSELRTKTAAARGSGRPGSERSSSPSRASATAPPTSPPSWSLGGPASRRSSP